MVVVVVVVVVVVFVVVDSWMLLLLVLLGMLTYLGVRTGTRLCGFIGDSAQKPLALPHPAESPALH